MLFLLFSEEIDDSLGDLLVLIVGNGNSGLLLGLLFNFLLDFLLLKDYFSLIFTYNNVVIIFTVSIQVIDFLSLVNFEVRPVNLEDRVTQKTLSFLDVFREDLD